MGDGAHTLLCRGGWLHGQKITDIATRFYVLVSKLRVNKRTVQETLIVNNWFADIQGALTVGVIIAFLELWHLNAQVIL